MTIVDDYAHHPAEIKATIDGARQKYPEKEIIAVFQPRTFTRTIALMDEFVEAFGLADMSIYVTFFRICSVNHEEMLKLKI